MKDFVEQIFTPFKSMSEHIKYRLSNPLGIAFVFSWIIFNWQAVYYFMFSNDTASSKITYLQKIYLTEKGYDLSNLLWCPLGASVLYLVVAPLVSNIATGLWSVIDKSCTALRLKFVENATLMTSADKDKMYLALNKLKEKHAAEVRTLREEISGLQSLLALHGENEAPNENKSGAADTTENIQESSMFEINRDHEEEIHRSDGALIKLDRMTKLKLLQSILNQEQRVNLLNKWFDQNVQGGTNRSVEQLKSFTVNVFSMLIDNNGEMDILTYDPLQQESHIIINKFFEKMKGLGFLLENDSVITLTNRAVDGFISTILK
ncbi:hypothetical protein [Shewanella scandinavica]|uniref:hypothetical protein n=1 Tax=Shewanella scandinavica TaxID=3063538 RepID=UPI0031866B8C